MGGKPLRSVARLCSVSFAKMPFAKEVRGITNTKITEGFSGIFTSSFIESLFVDADFQSIGIVESV